MKIDDLGMVLEVIDALDEKQETTEEFKELCDEMIRLTKGPSSLYEVVPAQAVAALKRVVELDEKQAKRAFRIFRNAIHVTIGTMVRGGVLQINQHAADLVSLLKEAAEHMMLGGGGEEESSESESEFEEEDHPTPKKEVIH